jgi:hypothetical protein
MNQDGGLNAPPLAKCSCGTRLAPPPVTIASCSWRTGGGGCNSGTSDLGAKGSRLHKRPSLNLGTRKASGMTHRARDDWGPRPATGRVTLLARLLPEQEAVGLHRRGADGRAAARARHEKQFGNSSPRCGEAIACPASAWAAQEVFPPGSATAHGLPRVPGSVVRSGSSSGRAPLFLLPFTVTASGIFVGAPPRAAMLNRRTGCVSCRVARPESSKGVWDVSTPFEDSGRATRSNIAFVEGNKPGSSRSRFASSYRPTRSDLP